MASHKERAKMSDGPPGGKLLISLTGLVGKLGACAKAADKELAQANASARVRRRVGVCVIRCDAVLSV